ncbi:MAG: hypothetical protein R6W78_02705 [Bacteroidales bacterium]
MKKYLLFIMAIPLLAAECEYRRFEFVATIGVNEEFIVDNTGSFSEKQTITRQQVLDALDIPEQAEIKEINIEKLSVRVTILENNQASLISASGRLQLGENKPDIFKDKTIPLVAVNAPFIGLNNLIAEGVSGLKSKLEGYIYNSDAAPFDIEIYGDSSPTTGQKINVKIELIITGSVIYEECIETISLVGEEC